MSKPDDNRVMAVHLTAATEAALKASASDVEEPADVAARVLNDWAARQRGDTLGEAQLAADSGATTKARFPNKPVR